MPWYGSIDLTTAEGKRTVERLLQLRSKLLLEIPKRRDDVIVIATWNIREFDSASYGFRTNEPMQYIAEIVNSFDIVALSEVRSDLRGLDRLMDLLGSAWDVVVTDVTSGRAGNDERLAVLYDSRKVSFGGLAGQLVLPPIETVDASGQRETVPASQFARTPLVAGFKSNWIDFQLAVFHIIWGSEVAQRRNEVKQLTTSITAKAGDPGAWSKNLVVLGDFNIGSPTDEAWKDLKRLGWVIPADFVQDIRGTNIAQDKYYDQIAILPRPGRFQIAQLDGGRPAAGAFNYYDLVYRPTADFETYRPVMEAHEPQAKRSNFTFNDEGKARTEEEQKRWYRQYWRTYQMSDHLPLWVALRTDNADDFLTDRLKEANQG